MMTLLATFHPLSRNILKPAGISVGIQPEKDRKARPDRRLISAEKYSRRLMRERSRKEERKRTDMGEEFFIENRIYYHDTDAGGVVYYATYLHHLEEGRNEYLRGRGIDLAQWARRGVEFPVVHLEAEYRSPARYGDLIRIYTRVEKIGNASLHFFQEIRRGEIVLVKAKTIWACVGKDFKAQPVPEEIRRVLLPA